MRVLHLLFGGFLVALVRNDAAAEPADPPPIAQATFPQHLIGDVSAAAELMDRVLPGSSNHFEFALVGGCAGVAKGTACFTLEDAVDGKVKVSATSASELTGGLGVYLREYCNMTIGWERGGGSRIFTPDPWPVIGKLPVTRARSVPYSHVTQVCTHSYTLVWHDWDLWTRFIDWMALAGHNSIVAPTGQEEVQYRVLTEQFGLADMEVRNWTNGPAFLTWSRGQNSHGNGIAGPLPRSFMKGQWELQKKIMARYRELGIAGHLPAFAGFAPWALAVRQNDTGKGGATRGRPGADWDTAWIDGRDPLFTRVGDAWMKQILSDFGSDHVWQMDAFFGNGTGWGDRPVVPDSGSRTACTWSAAEPNTYLKGCADRSSEAGGAQVGAQASGGLGHKDRTAPHPVCPSFNTLAEAKSACAQSLYPDCRGVTLHNGRFELRKGGAAIPVPASFAETSYRIENLACKWDLPPDPVYLARAKAAYGAVARADGPSARWLYQGWAIHAPGSGMSPPSPRTLSRLHGFSTVAPPGQFILMDMDEEGKGQWRDPWQGVWGIPFIWTSLPDFGGNIATHGNLSQINEIPWQAPPLSPVAPGYDPATKAVGVGYTPEGLDQNTAYYELLQEAAFKSGPERNLTDWLVRRAHRRYGLVHLQPAVASAWADIGASGYANEGPVHDGTGVGLMPAHGYPPWKGFSDDGTVPKPALCLAWRAWGSLVEAAQDVSPDPDQLPATYTYDLADAGREVLAQLTIPVSLNFSSALFRAKLDASRINATGSLYKDLLLDLDRLLATEYAFLLGPWLEHARNLADPAANDCNDTQIGDLSCPDFMMWNAKAQITTWHPTVSSTELGERPNDYARKHWSGLVSDYYAARVGQYMDQGLADAKAGRKFDAQAMSQRAANLAYTWQTTFPPPGSTVPQYPITPLGNPVSVSLALRHKYAHYFAGCEA